MIKICFGDAFDIPKIEEDRFGLFVDLLNTYNKPIKEMKASSFHLSEQDAKK